MTGPRLSFLSLLCHLSQPLRCKYHICASDFQIYISSPEIFSHLDSSPQIPQYLSQNKSKMEPFSFPPGCVSLGLVFFLSQLQIFPWLFSLQFHSFYLIYSYLSPRPQVSPPRNFSSSTSFLPAKSGLADPVANFRVGFMWCFKSWVLAHLSH